MLSILFLAFLEDGFSLGHQGDLASADHAWLGVGLGPQSAFSLLGVLLTEVEGDLAPIQPVDY